MIHLKRPLHAFVLIAVLNIFCCLRATATITVLHDWRLGESDPTAIAGASALATQDYIGGNQLVFQGNASYSSDVGFTAAAHSGSLLSTRFTNNAFASNSIVSTLTDNFGFEAWVKPESSPDGIILYNGRTDNSGWGFTIGTIVGSQRYSVIYGGVDVFGSYPATNGVWAHLALACSNGVSTFYVNNVLVATRAEIPNVPTGNFALACAPQVPGTQTFTGLIDEVRVFTFSPNSFSTSDLLLNSSIEKVEPLPATQITSSNALLNGAVTPGGLSTAGWLEWGLTTGYGNSNTPVSVGNGQSPVAISNQITGLLPGHAYHFRAVATNSSGTLRSWDQTFMTPVINVAGGVTAYAHVPFTNLPATLAAAPLILSANDGPNGIVLKADGTVSVWGDNTYGQTNFAAGLSNIIGVAAGDFHFVALRRDGTVVSWGKDTVGQSDTPAGLDNICLVAAGGDRSMAMRRDGSVTNWGSPLFFGATNIVQISASLSFVTALTVDGTILFGGSVPASATNVVSLASGAGHYMVLRADGNVVAWGNNGNGQTNVPPGVTNVAAISACGNGSMALMRDGSVIAWGSNDGNKNTIPPGVTNAVAIATAGGANFAMRKDGVVFGWGATTGNQTIVPNDLTNITGLIAISGANTNPPGIYPVTYTTTNFLNAANSATGSVSILSPALTLTHPSSNSITLAWPSNATGYTLQQSSTLLSNSWVASPSGATNPISIATTNSPLFYRLTHP